MTVNISHPVGEDGHGLRLSTEQMDTRSEQYVADAKKLAGHDA